MSFKNIPLIRVLLAPARNIPESVRTECERVGKEAIDTLLGMGVSGMFGVEVFCDSYLSMRLLLDHTMSEDPSSRNGMERRDVGKDGKWATSM
jgi:hypothetical protein